MYMGHAHAERRAKIFIDLTMLEAELSSINGVRAGQKSRDKKLGTCAALKNNTDGSFDASETCVRMDTIGFGRSRRVDDKAAPTAV